MIVIGWFDGFFVNPESLFVCGEQIRPDAPDKTHGGQLIADHIIVSAIAPGAFRSDMNRGARPRR